MHVNLLIITLRVLHIVSGVLWVGAVFVLATLMRRRSAASTETRTPTPDWLPLQRCLTSVLVTSSILAIGSGTALFRTLYERARWDWSHMDANEVYATGFFAAMLAFLLMISVAIPAGRAMRRNTLVWQSIAVLLLITVTTMAVGRYIF